MSPTQASQDVVHCGEFAEMVLAPGTSPHVVQVMALWQQASWVGEGLQQALVRRMYRSEVCVFVVGCRENGGGGVAVCACDVLLFLHICLCVTYNIATPLVSHTPPHNPHFHPTPFQETLFASREPPGCIELFSSQHLLFGIPVASLVRPTTVVLRPPGAPHPGAQAAQQQEGGYVCVYEYDHIHASLQGPTTLL